MWECSDLLLGAEACLPPGALTSVPCRLCAELAQWACVHVCHWVMGAVLEVASSPTQGAATNTQDSSSPCHEQLSTQNTSSEPPAL